MPLPIESVLPQLKTALTEYAEVVLQAPPGTRKTTLVPPALLHEEWLGGGRIMMLEPRRLAARAAARRIAWSAKKSAGRLAIEFAWIRE